MTVESGARDELPCMGAAEECTVFVFSHLVGGKAKSGTNQAFQPGKSHVNFSAVVQDITGGRRPYGIYLISEFETRPWWG
jgi:hypothetical protein